MKGVGSMNRRILIITAALLLATVHTGFGQNHATEMREWLIGEWAPIPEFILEHREIQGEAVYEPTLGVPESRSSITQTYRGDGTFISRDKQVRLWSIIDAGENWAIVREVSAENRGFLYSVARVGADAGIRVGAYPSRSRSGSSLIYSRMERQ